MYLIDGHKYSFDQIITGHNSKKTYNRSFTTLFLYKDRVCSTAHQITDQWFIKRRVGRKNINGNVEKNFFFVLYRTYLHHSYSTTFSNIICRIKNLITGIFEKCFLVICDWDEKKVYSASSKKPRHTEMLKHILQSLDPILEHWIRWDGLKRKETSKGLWLQQPQTTKSKAGWLLTVSFEPNQKLTLPSFIFKSERDLGMRLVIKADFLRKVLGNLSHELWLPLSLDQYRIYFGIFIFCELFLMSLAT